jgi:superoxide dismutase, Cu-Zn family
MEMGLEEKSAPMTVQKAICVLHPTEGNDVTGTVTFTQQGNDVKIVNEIILPQI